MSYYPATFVYESDTRNTLLPTEPLIKSYVFRLQDNSPRHVHFVKFDGKVYHTSQRNSRLISVVENAGDIYMYLTTMGWTPVNWPPRKSVCLIVLKCRTGSIQSCRGKCLL